MTPISNSAWTSLALLSLLAAAPPLAAQTPLDDAVSYQGLLTQGGTPFTGTATVELRLFGAESGGTALATSNFGSQSITDGLLSFCVNFGASVFDGDERWIEVVINGTPLAPRQAVCVAPYALYALATPGGISDGHSLDAADGSPVDALFVNNSGDVGIGSTSPGMELDVRSTASNTAGQVRAGNSVGDTWVMLWSGFSNGGNDPAIIWSDDVAADDLRFLTTSATGTGGAEHMRITSAGNVGIGTSAPEGRLHVRAPTGETLGKVVITPGAANSVSELHLAENTSASHGIILRNDGATTNQLQIVGLDADVETGTIAWFDRDTNNSGVTGNFGIGTTSPTAALQVVAPSGNASVALPGSSVAAAEIADEPGLASGVGSNQSLTEPAEITLVSRTITPPVNGYVVVLATTVVRHFQTDNITEVRICVNQGGSAEACVYHHLTNHTFQLSSVSTPTLHTVFQVTGGEAETFHMTGYTDESNPSLVFADPRLTLMFFPSAYGTVDVENP